MSTGKEVGGRILPGLSKVCACGRSCLPCLSGHELPTMCPSHHSCLLPGPPTSLPAAGHQHPQPE